MPRVFAELVAIALLGATLACGPSAFEIRKAAIDRRVKAAQQLTPPERGSPAGSVRMEPALGQWIEYLSLNSRRVPSFVTYKIVGMEVGSFWMEVLREGYHGRTITLLQVDPGDGLSPSSVRVLHMKIRSPDGATTEYTQERLQSEDFLWRPVLAGLVGPWEPLPREDVTVPAGSFRGCYKEKLTISAGMFKSNIEVWYHPTVPITGIVRRVDLEDFSTMELSAFGYRGAVSELR
jgi:hypothetical protein